MDFRAEPSCGFEPHADLDAFHGLNAHQGHRQTPRQSTVPLRVAAETQGRMRDHDLKYTAERIALMLGFPDSFDHVSGRRFIWATYLRRFRLQKRLLHSRLVADARLHPADLNRIAVDLHPEFGQ